MVKIKDLPLYDVADFLATPKMQAEYISVAFEEGTPEEIREAIRAVARARGMTQTAKAAGITREGLIRRLAIPEIPNSARCYPFCAEWGSR